MAKDTCLACAKPFPANKELASVSNGRLVAFDPDANRVWRVCAKCHHWNLLGQEASAAAMPELVVRFAALPSAGPKGVAKATASHRLDLFRIGGAQERAARILTLAKAKQELVTDTVKGVSIVLLALGAWTLHGLYQSVQHWGFAGITATMLATGTIGLLQPKAQRQRNRYDRYLPVPLILLGAAMTARGALEPKWAVVSVLAAVTFAALAAIDARRVAHLEWTPGTSDLRLREGSSVTDMLEVPQMLDPDAVTIDEATAAVDLLESLGNLPEALRYVCEQRGTPEGVLPFGDLTDEHRLLLAVAARIARVEPNASITAGHLEARAIAEVAESLDPANGNR